MFANLLKLSAVCVGLLGVNSGMSQAADGPVGGPISQVELIPGNVTDSYTVVLWDGGPTRIRLVGDGGTCLELRVYDANGDLVASDTLGFGDVRQVLFTPKTLGKYTIKIKNIGRMSNLHLIYID